MVRLDFGVVVGVCLVAGFSACNETDLRSEQRHESPVTLGQAPSAQAAIVDCSAAIVDRVDPQWRSRSVVRGNFGLYGNGRDIRTAEPWGSSAYWTKVPVIVAGHRTAILRVPPRSRGRIGLTYGPRSPSPASTRDGDAGLAAARREIRFEPCADRATTAWPGGLALADREGVELEVRREGGQWRSVEIVGRSG